MLQPLLVVIGYVWPEPKSSAAGSRMLQLIQIFLANQWQVVFASAAALSEHRFNLLTLGVEEKSIALNDSSFDVWIQEINPHAVLFDRFFTEEQFGWRVEKVCPNTLRLLDTEDFHSLRYARQQLLKEKQKACTSEKEKQSVAPVLLGLVDLYDRMALDEMTQREVAAIYRSDLSIMISQFEVELLCNNFGVSTSLLFYAPLLASQVIDRQARDNFLERSAFVSIGNFRHEPNWDSVLYLKHAIWPLIRAQLPNAELHIYGAYPPPKATQLNNSKEGFLVKGWVDDALPVMQSARVCLAPLRFGAGIKGKLMDAMICGTPSITTLIGAEAMSGGFAWGGAVENDANNFANAAVQIYEDHCLWQQAQQNGFAILENYFSREPYGEQFMQRISQLQMNLSLERKQNFIGSMLRHHSLKSTQYMSQWIEEKNKKSL